MRRGHTFLAVFLILLGGLLLLQLTFGMSAHLLGTAFALLLIMIGVFLIMRPAMRVQHHYGDGGWGGVAQWWFTGGSFTADNPGNHYAAYFSSCDVTVPDSSAAQIEVEAIFSSVHLRLPAGRRVNLVMDSVLGSVAPPPGITPSFGRNAVMFGEGDILNVYVRAVFGTVTMSVE